MLKPSGSWVAIPTPFDEKDQIDFDVFGELVDFHVQHHTSMLFCLGSAGEATMLSLEERKAVVHNMTKLCKGKIPCFFGSTMPTTEASIEFAQFAENEGADGLIFTAPSYLLPPQKAVLDFFLAVMSSVSIPVGIYNNPSRTGVNIDPSTVKTIADNCPNFVVDKEAMPNVSQIVEIRRQLGDRVNVLCCDFPKYSILLPTLALGGNGAANIGGNIIPEEMALMARPWTSIELVEECRETYFRYYDLLKALYWISNPVVIKAALRLLGFKVGSVRQPYQDLTGEKLEELRQIMDKLGVIEKYGRR